MADAPSDCELLTRFVEHKDEQAFTTLASRHGAWLCPAAERLLGDPGRAQDVVQAVLIVLARRAAKMRRDLPLSPWLFRTLHYAVQSLRRTEARRVRHETAAASARSEVTLDQAWHDTAEVIDRAVNRLPRHDREAILLRFYQGQSLAEVGNSMGTSEEAARKRLARAISRLRVRLESLGVTSAASLLATPDALCRHLSTGMTQSTMNTLATGALSARAGAGAAGTPLAVAEGVLNMMKLATLKAAAAMAIAVLSAGGAVALYAATPPHRPPANPPAPAGPVQTAMVNNAVPGLSPRIINPVTIASEPDLLIPHASTNAFNARLSPDGRYLLFFTAEGRPATATSPANNPRFILRDLQTSQNITVPTNMDPGVSTVFTRFNGFAADNQLLIFSGETKGGVNTQQRFFDLNKGAIVNGSVIESGSNLALPFRNGLIIGGRANSWRTDPPDYKPQPLGFTGMVNSVNPVEDVLVLLLPPQRSGPMTAPTTGPGSTRARIVLHDLKTGQRTELPMHPRNTILDDVEAQWTADGRYLYYSDFRDTDGGKTIPVCRIWDRTANKEAYALDYATAVGAGAGPDIMYLAWNPPAVPPTTNPKPGAPEVQGPLLIVHDMSKGAPGAPHQLLRGCEVQHGSRDKVAYLEKNATGQQQLKVATIRWE